MELFQSRTTIVSCVDLRLDEETCVRGLLVEITPDSATVDFPLARTSPLAVGQAYPVTFTGGRSLSSIECQSELVYRGEDTTRCRCRFRLRPDDAIGVSSLVENRGAMRVPPEEGLELRVRFWKSDAEQIVVPLESISRTGISVLVPLGGEEFFNTSESLNLSFRLPGQRDDVYLLASVRNCQPAVENTRFGLEFGASGAAYFTHMQRQIEDYVFKRQGDLMNELQAD